MDHEHEWSKLKILFKYIFNVSLIKENLRIFSLPPNILKLSLKLYYFYNSDVPRALNMFVF